eukprot:5792902-Amphidinium_carterae.1
MLKACNEQGFSQERDIFCQLEVNRILPSATQQTCVRIRHAAQAASTFSHSSAYILMKWCCAVAFANARLLLFEQ